MAAAGAIALIAILALGVLFALVYASDVLRNMILTHPSISKLQAIEAAANYSKTHVKGFTGLTIYDAKIGGYRLGYPYTDAPLYSTKLIYVHPNGTEYFINPKDDVIAGSCLPTNCGYGPGISGYGINLVNSTEDRGRLIYFIDGAVQSNYSDTSLGPYHPQSCLEVGFFDIDAMTGQLISSPMDRDLAGGTYDMNCYINPPE
jgi:hypothetical protein